MRFTIKIVEIVNSYKTVRMSQRNIYSKPSSF